MEYLINHYPKILNLLCEHIFLTFTSLFISMLIAFPIGIFASTHKKFRKITTKLLGLCYIIPSMALFALLIPFTGLGFKSAIITLVMYSQFILVRNITKGLNEVPNSIIDAGYGMGYSNIQLLFKIKLPISLPVILAGIRVATVSIISLTTLAAWINAGGLGVLIFEGIYQQNSIKILTGTTLITILSITSNQLITYLEKKYVKEKSTTA
ncbi:ABC transporter permease [Clostridium aestuarii]|uniref:ABC transporter permease n=1 Tax=Clostridium aestuarii TaxID=338193 RepID=A0ABT4D005_9CLOT|nr:ABC transporter permease [Clostridium aestuarii]MCY6484571.1 ABC transporter permease [Clostridium aestuarii]